MAKKVVKPKEPKKRGRPIKTKNWKVTAKATTTEVEETLGMRLKSKVGMKKATGKRERQIVPEPLPEGSPLLEEDALDRAKKATADYIAGKDKDPGSGRFIKGNKGGPGRRPASKLEMLYKAQLDAVTPEDIYEMMSILKEKAKEGNLQCIREVFDRTTGKPVSYSVIESLNELQKMVDDIRAGRMPDEDTEEMVNLSEKVTKMVHKENDDE